MALLDQLSGLLLVATVLVMLYFVLRELPWRRLSALTSKLAADDAKPVNEHLIGAVGTVVQPVHGEGTMAMKVRIGLERWNARPTSSAAAMLTAGTEVRVTAVNGTVLEVEPCHVAAQADPTQPQTGEAG